MYESLLNVETLPKEAVQRSKRLHLKNLVKREVCTMVISKELIKQSTRNIVTIHLYFSLPSGPSVQ